MKLSLAALWQFFASVKLALFTLFTLSATSIFGTFIEQGKAPEFYLDKYGESLAGFLELISLTNMYSSWWFVALLLLFATNLVVCSIERLPGVWRTVAGSGNDRTPEQLNKMACSFSQTTKKSVDETIEKIKEILAFQGWKKPLIDSDADSVRVTVQRGGWTRLAVYVVHASILVILAGALIGALFGFQAYIFLPEGRSSDKVFYQGNAEALPLGFEIHCDQAQKSFYTSGNVSEYRADMRIQDTQRGISFSKSVIVNDPLSYRGINFYLGDFHPIDEFFVVITDLGKGTEQAFRVGAEMDFTWPDTVVTARIEEFTRGADGAVLLARMSLSADPSVESTDVWVRNTKSVSIEHAGQKFSVSLQQLTSVLLLVNKDPGVLIVWAGFVLLSIGLYISFFMSHRRIWVCLLATGKGTQVVVGGSSNKNRPGFEKLFSKLNEQVNREL